MFHQDVINESVEIVSNIDDLEVVMKKLKEAQEEFSMFTQEQVDVMCNHVIDSILVNKDTLASLEIEETGVGVYEDKISKIFFSSYVCWNYFKDMKTCGVIKRDPEARLMKVASPIGIISCLTPITNPVPSAIFKAICCLKSRNAMILSPHVKSQECVLQTLGLIAVAAEEMGAPRGLFSMVYKPTEKMTSHTMRHPLVGLVWATGGSGLVRQAYSSGKPSLGVGAGNVPVVLHPTCDIEEAMDCVYTSKKFDNGVLCTSEEVIIVPECIYNETMEILELHPGIALLNKHEGNMVARTIKVNGHLNPKIVGQDAITIANMSGLSWVTDKRSECLVLAHEVDAKFVDTDTDSPWLYEKLSPLIAIVKVADEIEAVEMAKKILSRNGEGHSAIVHINYDNSECDRYLEYCGRMLSVSRVTVNQGGSFGTAGGPLNGITPTCSLGCGSWGGNSTTENISPMHLINVKNVFCMQEGRTIVARGGGGIRLMARTAVELFMELLGRVSMVVMKGKAPSTNLRKSLRATFLYLLCLAGKRETTAGSLKTVASGTDLIQMYVNQDTAPDIGAEDDVVEEELTQAEKEKLEKQFKEALRVYEERKYGKKVHDALKALYVTGDVTAIPRSQLIMESLEHILEQFDMFAMFKALPMCLEAVNVYSIKDVHSFSAKMKDLLSNLNLEKNEFALKNNLSSVRRSRLMGTSMASMDGDSRHCRLHYASEASVKSFSVVSLKSIDTENFTRAMGGALADGNAT